MTAVFSPDERCRYMRMAEHDDLIEDAIRELEQERPEGNDGVWLEDLTAKVAPLVQDWEVREAWTRNDCPWREELGIAGQDIGIDVVAQRNDGEFIAIQCKSRMSSAPIRQEEMASFVSASSDTDRWAERWVLTNRGVAFAANAIKVMDLQSERHPVKAESLHAALVQERLSRQSEGSEACPHCVAVEAGEELAGVRRTKSCMQKEAVDTAVEVLRKHELVETGGIPRGQARGRIILPCGTGKTRISLRIVERLTPPDGFSIVLCPSIALVAQIRREYLQHAQAPVRALAVCSDKTAGYDGKNELRHARNPGVTDDTGNVSASAVKGRVTTDAGEIADWIECGATGPGMSVMFGTYQSAHRISEALLRAKAKASVLVCDEAHRTAGIRRARKREDEEALRNFTICHNNDRFPATYRVYQTATPKVYGKTAANSRSRQDDYLVQAMDDEATFGVELYRRSYREAVENAWLADYRIIAVGINDRAAYETANKLAQTSEKKKPGRLRVGADHYLRGLAFALAMSNAVRRDDESDTEGDVRIRSCIGFMNSIEASQKMVKGLNSDATREWLGRFLAQAKPEAPKTPANFSLEHLDASSNVLMRDEAKAKLAQATDDAPHGILNVGIFGEGTDSPSLSAVAFLEPRKSPIDVIQAVGRAMRISEGKDYGYIIVPVVIPPDADPEEWLRTRAPDEGWNELGQILLAMRAHDDRIEDRLADLLELHLPPVPEKSSTAVAVTQPDESMKIGIFHHIGKVDEAQRAAEKVAKGQAKAKDVGLTPMPSLSALEGRAEASPEVSLLMATRRNADGTVETRTAGVPRKAWKDSKQPPEVRDEAVTKSLQRMVNRKEGVPRKISTKKREDAPNRPREFLLTDVLAAHADAIRVNLLTKSGLQSNRIERDMNVLRECVRTAARHLSEDSLQAALDRHFHTDRLAEKSRNDSCAVAALLLMNAAMLHQRVAAGQWLPGISSLAEIKNETNVVRRVEREWNRITRHDFQAVLAPALNVIEAIDNTGKTVGLERALRHVAASAEMIAATYADMGTDHAGAVYNEYMGNQASDGAFFTRPVAASLTAMLAFDVCGDLDWSDHETARANRVVDLACGSGTLLAATLSEMKRRAREEGASDEDLADLQKVAGEDALVGMDINSVSLQLAASQLTAGNRDVKYKRMRLHTMPYGPDEDGSVAAGTLELFTQEMLVPRPMELPTPDPKIAARDVWNTDAEVENAADTVAQARLAIMNPPFSSRMKMGEKFPAEVKAALRRRVDKLFARLSRADPDLGSFDVRNSLHPLFVALADRCLREDGVMAMVCPTIALATPSGLTERRVLAQRYRVHTVLSCYQPGNVNLSQNTGINESIIVLRKDGTTTNGATRFISLDRLPGDDAAVGVLHEALLAMGDQVGVIADGWGEVSFWPSDRVAEGDWTRAVFRASDLADAARHYAVGQPDLSPLGSFEFVNESGVTSRPVAETTNDKHLYAKYRKQKGRHAGTRGSDHSFDMLGTKGADGQQSLRSRPDQRWEPKDPSASADAILDKAAFLLVTSGQDTRSARLTSVAGDVPYVGIGWTPVSGIPATAAKAWAVFVNSTPGRLQLLRAPGKKLDFPNYNPVTVAALRVPDVNDPAILAPLLACYERTCDMPVPQFRDGECEVRRLWDEAVAEAMGWDAEKLARERLLLHQEPHVRGLGYGEFGFDR